MSVRLVTDNLNEGGYTNKRQQKEDDERRGQVQIEGAINKEVRSNDEIKRIVGVQLERGSEVGRRMVRSKKRLGICRRKLRKGRWRISGEGEGGMFHGKGNGMHAFTCEGRIAEVVIKHGHLRQVTSRHRSSPEKCGNSITTTQRRDEKERTRWRTGAEAVPKQDVESNRSISNNKEGKRLPGMVMLAAFLD